MLHLTPAPPLATLLIILGACRRTRRQIEFSDTLLDLIIDQDTFGEECQAKLTHIELLTTPVDLPPHTGV